MKNCYKKGSYASTIICIVVCVLVLAMFFSEVVTGSRPLPWQLLLIVAFVSCVAVYTFNAARTFRKECELIRKHGVCCKGTVIQFGKSSRTASDSSSTSYRFLIEYYSSEQREVVSFWTPYTTIRPKEDSHMVCNVYEYKGKVIADDFQVIGDHINKF